MGSVCHQVAPYKYYYKQGEEEYEYMTKTKGTIKFFNTQKGFGFIMPDDGSKEIFVHINNVKGGNVNALREGAPVEYEVGSGRKGPEATNVTVL
jgi:cold shock protein